MEVVGGVPVTGFVLTKGSPVPYCELHPTICGKVIGRVATYFYREIKVLRYVR